MADLTITAANVVPAANAVKDWGSAGEAVTAGQPLYQKAADKLWYKADNNAATEEARTATGLCLTGSAAGQPVAVQKGGDVTIGATITAGVDYYLSDTAGGICPVADVGVGEYVCRIGIAKSTTLLSLDFSYPGVQK